MWWGTVNVVLHEFLSQNVEFKEKFIERGTLILYHKNVSGYWDVDRSNKYLPYKIIHFAYELRFSGF